MGDDEKLTVREKEDRLHFAIQKQRGFNEYKRTLANRDYKLLALIFYELERKGYPVIKAYARFLELLDNPDLFFA